MTNSDNMARLTLCFSTIWDIFTPSLVPMLGFWRHFLKHPLKLFRAVCISGNITFVVLLGHLNISSLVACFLHDLPTGVHMLLDYHIKEHEVLVLQLKNSKCLWLAKKHTCSLTKSCIYHPPLPLLTTSNKFY